MESDLAFQKKTGFLARLKGLGERPRVLANIFIGLFYYVYALEIFVFSLYLLGNFQDFLDESQFLLLKLLNILVFIDFTWGIFLIVFLKLFQRIKPIFSRRWQGLSFFLGQLINLFFFVFLQFFFGMLSG